jgi:hypothetical protein
MGIWGWVVLLAASAALATVVQFVFLSRNRRPSDQDWVFIAGGGLVGGFTGHAWYVAGPTVDGLNVVPALVGLAVGAALAETIYRLVLRRRQP